MRAEDAQTATAPRATPARDAAIAALEQYRGARGAGGRVEAWHDLPAAAVVDVVLASAAGPETDPVLFEVTDRGFRRYEPIPTAYGHVVSVYESSAASEPCVWLEIDANSAHQLLHRAKAGLRQALKGGAA